MVKMEDDDRAFLKVDKFDYLWMFTLEYPLTVCWRLWFNGFYVKFVWISIRLIHTCERKSPKNVIRRLNVTEEGMTVWTRYVINMRLSYFPPPPPPPMVAGTISNQCNINLVAFYCFSHLHRIYPFSRINSCPNKMWK